MNHNEEKVLPFNCEYVQIHNLPEDELMRFHETLIRETQKRNLEVIQVQYVSPRHCPIGYPTVIAEFEPFPEEQAHELSQALKANFPGVRVLLLADGQPRG